MAFKVKKHCEDFECTGYVIEWPSAADKDGIPVLGLIWPDAKAMQPFTFPDAETAAKFAELLNQVMHDDDPKGPLN